MLFDIGAAVGGIASGVASAKAADKSVKRQIAWERERATHAHQWEVEDLKAAGLNPILSAGGSGATTGGITAPVPDFSGIAGISASSSAAQEARTAAKAQKAQEKLQGAQVKQAEQNTKNLQLENKILAAQARAENANSATTVLKNEREQKYLKSKLGSALNYAGRGFQDVGGAISGALLGGLGMGIGKGISAAKAAKAAKAATTAKTINPKTMEKVKSFTLGADGKLHANW